MESFQITVSKDSLVFCAAHFITYGEDRCERLHGHNYRVGVKLGGRLDDHALVYDFLDVRARMEELVAELDHRTLLPDSNPHFELEREEGAIQIRHRSREYRFPAEDVVLLPIVNTTAEMLASHLAERLLQTLRGEEEAASLESLAVEVEESFGQSAVCRRSL